LPPLPPAAGAALGFAAAAFGVGLALALPLVAWRLLRGFSSSDESSSADGSSSLAAAFLAGFLAAAERGRLAGAGLAAAVGCGWVSNCSQLAAHYY